MTHNCAYQCMCYSLTVQKFKTVISVKYIFFCVLGTVTRLSSPLLVINALLLRGRGLVDALMSGLNIWPKNFKKNRCFKLKMIFEMLKKNYFEGFTKKVRK